MRSVKQELAIGALKLSSLVLMAPMAGYTDLPFRLCLRRLGGLGLAYTEMLNPGGFLVSRKLQRSEILKTTPEDRPLGYQIYGKDPDIMARGAQWLEQRGAELIDLNMGCPQRKISARGAGAGLLKTPEKAVEIARQVVQAVKIPVTAKMRLGWDSPWMAAQLAGDLEKVGVAAIAVHGRTKAQGFAGKADYEGIRAVVEAVKHIPVIANGDIVSIATAREMFQKTGCAAIMLGRFALKEPWIIRDIARDLAGDPPLPRPTAGERDRILRDHFDGYVKLYGEKSAVLRFRKWIPLYFKGHPDSRASMVSLLRIKDVAEWLDRVPAALSAVADHPAG